MSYAVCRTWSLNALMSFIISLRFKSFVLSAFFAVNSPLTRACGLPEILQPRKPGVWSWLSAVEYPSFNRKERKDRREGTSASRASSMCSLRSLRSLRLILRGCFPTPAGEAAGNVSAGSGDPAYMPAISSLWAACPHAAGSIGVRNVQAAWRAILGRATNCRLSEPASAALRAARAGYRGRGGIAGIPASRQAVAVRRR